MDFSGDFTIDKPLLEVKSFFSDISNVMPCLPGVYDSEISNESIKCKLKLDISGANISTMRTISGRMNFVYRTNNTSLNIEGSGRIAGSKITFKIDIKFENLDDKSHISWKSSFDFGIIIKMMSRDKLNQISMENIDKTMECIKSKL